MYFLKSLLIELSFKVPIYKDFYKFKINANKNKDTHCTFANIKTSDCY